MHIEVSQFSIVLSIISQLRRSDYQQWISCPIPNTGTEVPELETDFELVWVKLQIVACKTLYLGSFYQPPEYLDQLNSSLKRNLAYKNSHVLIGWDFNCGDIDWNYVICTPGDAQETGAIPFSRYCSGALPFSGYRYPYTKKWTLDIMLTDNPTPVTRVKVCPQLDKLTMI